MKAKISIYDFSFTLVGYGQYAVEYTSPVTGRKWSNHVTDMELIDATKNSDSPKIKDSNALKFVCKQGYYGIHYINE